MSNKIVEIRQPDRTKVDAFVENGKAPTEELPPGPHVSAAVQAPIAMKTMTADIPESLHAELKVECARLDVKNYEVVRKALAYAVRELKKRSRDEGRAWVTEGA